MLADACVLQVLGEPETGLLRPGIGMRDQLALLDGALIAVALTDRQLTASPHRLGTAFAGTHPRPHRRRTRPMNLSSRLVQRLLHLPPPPPGI
jgi:hypothetical protein